MVPSFSSNLRRVVPRQGERFPCRHMDTTIVLYLHKSSEVKAKLSVPSVGDLNSFTRAHLCSISWLTCYYLPPHDLRVSSLVSIDGHPRHRPASAHRLKDSPQIDIPEATETDSSIATCSSQPALLDSPMSSRACTLELKPNPSTPTSCSNPSLWSEDLLVIRHHNSLTASSTSTKTPLVISRGCLHKPE